MPNRKPETQIRDERLLELLVSKIESQRWRRPRELLTPYASALLEQAHRTLERLRYERLWPDASRREAASLEDAGLTDPEKLCAELLDLNLRLERSWAESMCFPFRSRPQTRLQSLPHRSAGDDWRGPEVVSGRRLASKASATGHTPNSPHRADTASRRARRRTSSA